MSIKDDKSAEEKAEFELKIAAEVIAFLRERLSEEELHLCNKVLTLAILAVRAQENGHRLDDLRHFYRGYQ